MISPVEFKRLCRSLASRIEGARLRFTSIYGVPRGGIYVAIELSNLLDLPLANEVTGTTLVVDDLIDSGTTRMKYQEHVFACLHLKDRELEMPRQTYFVESVPADKWVEYFWEIKEHPAEDVVTRILEAIGENPTRSGLLETPQRVTASWAEIYKGYKQSPAEIIKIFDDVKTDELVLLKDIELYSMCEHHMLPFIGRAHVGYIPDGKVIGISKLARLVEIYARRLQIQERIGEQVVDALMVHLKPKGAACVIQAQHLCMRMRGVAKQNSSMITSALRGAFLENASARAELMGLIR